MDSGADRRLAGDRCCVGRLDPGEFHGKSGVRLRNLRGGGKTRARKRQSVRRFHNRPIVRLSAARASPFWSPRAHSRRGRNGPLGHVDRGSDRRGRVYHLAGGRSCKAPPFRRSRRRAVVRLESVARDGDHRPGRRPRDAGLGALRHRAHRESLAMGRRRRPGPCRDPENHADSALDDTAADRGLAPPAEGGRDLGAPHRGVAGRLRYDGVARVPRNYSRAVRELSRIGQSGDPTDRELSRLRRGGLRHGAQRWGYLVRTRLLRAGSGRLAHLDLEAAKAERPIVTGGPWNSLRRRGIEPHLVSPPGLPGAPRLLFPATRPIGDRRYRVRGGGPGPHPARSHGRSPASLAAGALHRGLRRHRRRVAVERGAGRQRRPTPPHSLLEPPVPLSPLCSESR